MEVLTLPLPTKTSRITACFIRRLTARLSVLALLAGGFHCASPLTLAQVRRPYEVKAAFLYNFTRFIEWPTNAFASPQSTFVIGIAGDENVAAELQAIVKDDKVRNRPLAVRLCRRPRDAEGCHLLYVGSAERFRAEEFLDAVKGRPVLTVGDAPDFLSEGGIIQFVTERTIRLRINVRNARAANLTLSSQLLRLAEIEKQ